MQQDGDRLMPTGPGRPRSHSDMTVRFEEPDKNNTVSSKPSTSSTVRPTRAGTWRDSIGGLTLDGSISGSNASPLLKSIAVPNGSIYKSRRVKLNTRGAAASAALAGRIPGAPPPPPVRSSRRESMFFADSPVPGPSYSPRMSLPTGGRRTSLVSNMPSQKSSGSDEKVSINGWTVKVKKLAAGELESVIKSHASLMWSPKYLRGLGRRALVIDDDENDETAKLLFEKPRATAWFPVSCLDLLWRGGEKGKDAEGKEKKKAKDEVRRKDDEKATEKKAIVRTLAVGDSACLISSSSALVGTVVAIDDDSVYPILMRWEGDVSGKVKTSYHKDEELKKVDVRRQQADAYDPETVVFHHYDDNNDGYWSLEETNRCLRETGQMLLARQQYCEMCHELQCDPEKGFLLADLRSMMSSKEVQRIYNALKTLLKKSNVTPSGPADMSPGAGHSPKRSVPISYWSSPERWSSPSRTITVDV